MRMRSLFGGAIAPIIPTPLAELPADAEDTALGREPAATGSACGGEGLLPPESRPKTTDEIDATVESIEDAETRAVGRRYVRQIRALQKQLEDKWAVERRARRKALVVHVAILAVAIGVLVYVAVTR